MQKLFDHIAFFLTEVDRRLEPLARDLALVADKLEPMIRAFLLWDSIAKAREETGWLPYRTVPFIQYFNECGGDTRALAARVSNYYENHELAIVKDIESRLAGYDVDEEAKATLHEALLAHKQGLFRCSCRVLLPEIERVIREDWLGIEGVSTLNANKLRDAINQKELSDFLLSWTLRIFGRYQRGRLRVDDSKRREFLNVCVNCR